MDIKVEIKNVLTDSPTPIKAFASVVFDNGFVIKKVKVIQARRGLFVALPSYKGLDGKWYEMCHPITAEFREKLNEAVMEAYEAACGE